MMKTKRHFLLKSGDLLFAPYLKEMIPTYHQWMSDPEILYLTASEPLSMEEEYQCQEEWIKDPNKYTFIILQLSDKDFDIQTLAELKLDAIGNEILKIGTMVGDINLFFHEYIEANEAEIDVMIGEKSFRKKGIAQKAVEIMMQFGVLEYKKQVFIAKIKADNAPSINLFKTKLNFEFVKEVTAFNEIEFRRNIDKEDKHFELVQLINV